MSDSPAKLSTSIVIASAAAAAAAAGVVYLWYYYKKNPNRIPTKWKLVGYVDKVAIYPVKSCGYQELDEADCTEIGLREIPPESGPRRHLFQDREFVIYDIKDKEVLKLMKQRRAVLISVRSEDEDTVVFQAPDVEDYKLKLSPIISNPIRIDIGRYGHAIETVDCGDDAAKWLSNFLVGQNEGFRLGYYVENVSKKPNVVKILSDQSKEFLSVYKHMRVDDGGLYSWLTSYLVVNKSSFDELNDRLAEEDQITIYNFRPNIIVNGCKPFEEDDWKWIKINDGIIMRYFKPCTRCAVTTINADTAERNKNLQPLKTLRSYRKLKDVKGLDLQGDLTVFGANMGLYVPGRIKVGDAVYVNV